MYQYLKRAIIAGLVCGLFLSCGLGIRKFLVTSDIFRISSIEVQASVNSDVEKIKDVYKVLIGKNIFAEIPEEVLFYNDPWISKLEIRRVLPDKVLVFITEEEALLTFRRGGSCLVLTASGKEIPASCEGVLVTVNGRVLDRELWEFIRLHRSSPTIQQSVAMLNPGLFKLDLGTYKVTASYEKGVFEENIRIFMDHIRQRYSSFESIDISVRGKIYVKGGNQ
jgi:cell division septal protein FtsQ